ncbi:oxygen-dependent tRNA uridine(34) hydroxylase TrhO [Reichenbachiella versicolor]|uniref:oxygen-dependent tRNA uridine(34) hydroxylase TrhO n=1 Tax=Reichenbachiella versicolor TaxID=1821036 RepID=UPI000D6E92FE|nr:rhodanese-related sulfurtransferase [Reichenbachiella versicolor]
MPLYNKVNKDVLRQEMHESNEQRVTLSFYKYHQIEDPSEFRDQFYATFQAIGTMGRVYVAHEGINGQVSVPEENFDKFKEAMYAIDFLNQVRLNIAVDDDGKSFIKLIVKVRDKVVADGLDDSTFDPSDCGTHLDVEAFNKITDQEDTVVIDMRNHYESEVGHFKGALLPDADTFRDALPMAEEMIKDDKDKNIVMYCTGGIRCEKASAYFKHQGFENVYQLEGGIIKYAQDAKEKGLENKFIGKNFVFDERLGERISDDVISNCHQCGKPCDTHINCKNDACHLLFIQCEECAKKYDQCCSTDCQDVLKLPKDEQKKLRQGRDLGRQVFKKGRWNKSLID